MRTPSPCFGQIREIRRCRACVPDRRTGWRMRSTSCASAPASSRLARPRTISRSYGSPAFSHRARPLSTSSRASESISCRRARDFGDDRLAQIGQGAPFGQGIEEIRRLAHRGRGLARRRGEDAVLDLPSAKTSTTSARSGAEADKLDMADRGFTLWRQHKARAMGDAGQRRADLVEQGGDIAVRSTRAWRRSSRGLRRRRRRPPAGRRRTSAGPAAWERARPRYAGCRAGPDTPDPASRCGSWRR